MRLDLPETEVARHKLGQEEMPQGLSPEEVKAYLRGRDEGTIPPGEVIDWGYGKCQVPLDVLRAHARLEGPFTCEAETEDPTLETTAELGMDFTIEVEDVDPEAPDGRESCTRVMSIGKNSRTPAPRGA